jgi:HD-GYP domain-containing protein (c-di-GMP phosphodiesterase class II)
MPSSDPPNDLRRTEIVGALSLASDLGMGHPSDLGLRTCVLAVRFARELGVAGEALRDVYDLSLLRFAGCTADSDVAARAFGDEIAARGFLAPADFGRPVDVVGRVARNLRKGEGARQRVRAVATAITHMSKLFGAAQAHCEVARRLAERLGFPPGVVRLLDQVFERWDGRGIPNGYRGDAVARSVRIVQLAHDAEIYFRLAGIEGATTMLQDRSGGAHEPRLVSAFCRSAEALFAGREERSAWDAVLDAEPAPTVRLNDDHLDAALGAVGDFADLKSLYTRGGSAAGAALAAGATRRLGFAESDVRAVRRAALLRDLGRAGVSASIWDKPGRLTDVDWEKVRLHPYFTERCLARSPTLSRLAAHGAAHHERLDGSGYHKSLPAPLLSPMARLVAAADAYVAMTSRRPHRDAMTPDKAAAELRRDAKAGRLADEAVEAVLAEAGHEARRAAAARPAGLTDREVEVLGLIATGLSMREAGRALGVSPKTVDHHIQHIYAKIGVSTRAGAALFAMEHGLVAK